MAQTLDERVDSIEKAIKELGNQIESLGDELRTVKLTIDEDAEIKGNLTVHGKIAGLLADDTVGNAQIVAQVITADKIKNAEIGSNLLADNAVTSAKIADGQVGTEELANSAVTGNKIKPGEVTKTLLANDVQKSLVACVRSLVKPLNPDAFNDWLLDITLPSGPYYVIVAVNGDFEANGFHVRGVTLNNGNSVHFYAEGGASAPARLNVVIFGR